VLVILQVHLQGVDQEVGIHPDCVGVEGPPTDGNNSKLVTEPLPLVIKKNTRLTYYKTVTDI